MPKKKDNSPPFAELIGEVERLPPARARATPVSAIPPATLPSTAERKTHRVELEQTGEFVLGRASDVPPPKINELRHGPLTPSRDLDLHGMSAAKARAALRQAVKLARADGLRCLVVICGKGSHSGPRGAVLPSLVVETLVEDCAADLQGFRSAPPSFGGHGAIIVRLRSRQKDKRHPHLKKT